MGQDSFAINRANWDDRASAHAAAARYKVQQLIADPHALSQVVRFDLPRLGEIAGLDVVHLQCHIGTDTLSLAHLGARMTGLDFSAASIEQARSIADRAGFAIDYRHANVYDAVEVLGAGRFDLVFTGIGALCWLPRVDAWAQVVAALLRPGGRLFIREGHPMLWTIDKRDDAMSIEFGYFEHVQPVVYHSTGTYVETDSCFQATESHTWNRGLGEIVTALQEAGMALTMLVEHDSVPWNALPGLMTESDGEWRLSERPERLAASYTLQAVRHG